MTDRRRSADHKQVSGYVPVELAREFKSICAREGVSQSDALEEMIREWIATRTGSNTLKSEQASPKTIADLVVANKAKLKRCGVKNLQALAKGEVLPTPGDFALIMLALEIPEFEQKLIWQHTFNLSLYDDDSGGIKQSEFERS